MTPLNKMPNWPDARGWIGFGIFAISIMLLWMMKDRSLREDEFFQTIATVIISNGLMAVVAWAYAATKGGGEQADKMASIAQTATEAVAASTPASDTPQAVVIEQPPEKPVPVQESAESAEGLPDYAR